MEGTGLSEHPPPPPLLFSPPTSLSLALLAPRTLRRREGELPGVLRGELLAVLEVKKQNKNKIKVWELGILNTNKHTQTLLSCLQLVTVPHPKLLCYSLWSKLLCIQQSYYHISFLHNINIYIYIYCIFTNKADRRCTPSGLCLARWCVLKKIKLSLHIYQSIYLSIYIFRER